MAWSNRILTLRADHLRCYKARVGQANCGGDRDMPRGTAYRTIHLVLFSSQHSLDFAGKLQWSNCYFIGLVQLNSIWQWTDGNALIYTNWFQSYPGNGQGVVLVTSKSAADYSYWEDVTSDRNDWPAICETSLIS